MQVYSAGMNLATVTNHNIIISTNNTERMSIASGGDVAFGNSVANTVSNYNNQPGGGFVASDSHFEFATTSNRAPVEIGKNNATDGQLVVLRKQNTTVGSIVYSSATNIALGNASKGIGIGTGSVFPTNGSTAISDAGLDLGYSSSRWKDLYLSGTAYVDTAVEIHAGNPLKLQNVAGNGFATIQNAGAGTNTDLSFNTAGSEAMRITSGGRLLIGTTAQNAGYGNNNDGMTLTKSGPTVFSNSASDYGLVLNKTSPQSGSTFYQVNFRSANTNVGGIFTNSSSTTYATTSDYRLKEAVVDMTGAIDRVKALAPKRFNFIADPDTTVDGFLAHEAQAVVPEAVTGTHNEVDENGDAVMQAIDQSKLVPLLTGALREAITKIETLETENSTQATQIADLITRVTALEAS
jgi:hypothetical protein